MKSFLAAMQFMTRIPINKTIVASEAEMGSSSKYFPIIGFIIGFFLFIIDQLSSLLLPSLVVGAILLIAEVLITGGLHVDGYLDTMDGLLSSRPKETALEIMKDSRVGAHSVTAFFALFILKYSIIVGLLNTNSIYGIFLMPIVGRWVMQFCICFFPYARENGLGKIFSISSDKRDWYFSTLTFMLIILFFLPWNYLLVITITFLIMLTPILKINKFLNGHTGDTYGAINELTEVLFIFLCLLLRI
ncbi:MAG: adenosylcobinamide-GDP ribazoletransferase [Peptococcaceae bacterium]